MLALLALALQLVISFGHMHPEDFFPVSAAHAQSSGPGQTQTHPGLPDDDCAICLNMAMIAASALPPPIVPAAPVAVAFHVLLLPAPALPRSVPPRTYRSRGPPTA